MYEREGNTPTSPIGYIFPQVTNNYISINFDIFKAIATNTYVLPLLTQLLKVNMSYPQENHCDYSFFLVRYRQIRNRSIIKERIIWVSSSNCYQTNIKTKLIYYLLFRSRKMNKKEKQKWIEEPKNTILAKGNKGIIREKRDLGEVIFYGECPAIIYYLNGDIRINKVSEDKEFIDLVNKEMDGIIHLRKKNHPYRRGESQLVFFWANEEKELITYRYFSRYFKLDKRF